MALLGAAISRSLTETNAHSAISSGVAPRRRATWRSPLPVGRNRIYTGPYFQVALCQKMWV